MLTIGITGGIGSGKSTVCRVFSALAIPVFQADIVARKLQDENPLIIQRLKELFGDEIYTEENKLDRKKLAGIIFNNRHLLEQINQLVHPIVHKEFETWKAQQNNIPYVLYEAAILFETGSFRNFDFTVLVVTDQKERIERVMKRDHVTKEAVEQRMHNQLSDNEKRRMADFIIENNDNQLIIPQILKLDNILKSKSHVWKMDR